MRTLEAILLTLLLSSATCLWACPMCKDAVNATSPATDGSASISRQAQGYYYSIVGMVSMPFVLAGAVAFGIVRELRQSGRRLNSSK